MDQKQEKYLSYLTLRKKIFDEVKPFQTETLLQEEAFYKEIKSLKEPVPIVYIYWKKKTAKKINSFQIIEVDLEKKQEKKLEFDTSFFLLDPTLFDCNEEEKIKKANQIVEKYKKHENVENPFHFHDVYQIEKRKRVKKIVDFLLPFLQKRKITIGICKGVHQSWSLIEELDFFLTAYNKKRKEERYEYLYDKACFLLDRDFSKYQLCGFQNEICLSRENLKEKGKKIPFVYGCCYTKGKVCQYLKNGRCTIFCLSCKLFTCSYLKKQGICYSVEDFFFLSFFLNRKQKMILNDSLYTKKEGILYELLKR